MFKCPDGDNARMIPDGFFQTNGGGWYSMSRCWITGCQKYVHPCDDLGLCDEHIEELRVSTGGTP